MIPDPPPNTRAHPYRGLSVQEVDVPLTAEAVASFLLGRRVYRRTEYLALRGGEGTALVAVRKRATAPLFSPVTEARMLAGPEEVVFVEDPTTDVGNATALARVALAHGTGARATVVLGRYEHVNFIWEPSPLRIRVMEVTPPEPPKLYDQARRVVEFDEDLPPVELVLDAVNIPALARQHPAARYLLPCRGSGVDLPAPVAFLDAGPAERAEWLLIGCERSGQIHQQLYGEEAPRVDLCPLERMRSEGVSGGPVLTKCCLRERGVEVTRGRATVPWGASLDEVRAALRLLADVDDSPVPPSGMGSPGATPEVRT